MTTATGQQILTLTGLRFDANLGILAHEKQMPQPIQVDAELSLESLIGKLAQRLMQLPGVLGVRVKIAKLEIFDDCEVAIRVETGQW
jgi:dihydroneopterin aldolase